MEIIEHSDRIEVQQVTFAPSVSEETQVFLDPLVLSEIKTHTSCDEEKIKSLRCVINITKKTWHIMEDLPGGDPKGLPVVTIGVWFQAGNIEFFNQKTEIICKF